MVNNVLMLLLTAMVLLAGPKDGRWALHSGTTVSFVMVRPKDKSAWRPDGSTVGVASFPSTGFPIWSNNKGVDPILVAFVNPIQKVNRAPTVRFKLPDTGILESSFDLIAIDNRGKEKAWVAGIAPGKQPTRQDVAIGVADGPWKTVGWVSYRGVGKQLKSAGLSFSPDLTPLPPLPGFKGPHQIAITVRKADTRDKVFRVVAFDKHGKALQSAGSLERPKKPGAITYAFEAEDPDLGMIKFEERPCEWTVVTAAHFKPSFESVSVSTR